MACSDISSQTRLADLEDIIPPPRPIDFDHLIPTDKNQDNLFTHASKEKVYQYLQDLATHPKLPNSDDKKVLDGIKRELSRRYKINPKTAALRCMYNALVEHQLMTPDETLNEVLISKRQRGQLGVIVVTVLTPPKTARGKFSCKFDCYYCPNEPGQARSYLTLEPAVSRANRMGYDIILQFRDRLKAYKANGHPLDKIELLVLGGTWNSYHRDDQFDFISQMYYAANTIHLPEGELTSVPRRSMWEERNTNRTAACRIIGLTLETRPDQITPEVIRDFRSFGCTRVQLGIQHTWDPILKRINRRCYLQDTLQAIYLLKNACYKIDIHIMPDLPDADPIMDLIMFAYILYSQDLQVDQWKIYPCSTVDWTVIKRWYEKGIYGPYFDFDPGTIQRPGMLMEVIMWTLARVHPWIRLNRVIRDIPNDYIKGGNDITHMRNVLRDIMQERGEQCIDIRARQIADQKTDITQAKWDIYSYRASGGLEYFISLVSSEGYLYGFVRLRINDHPEKNIFEELKYAGLIREAHVYGFVKAVSKDGTQSQHVGFGQRMMRMAESITFHRHGLFKMAVIAGEGAQEYYANKLEYQEEGSYMTKLLESSPGVFIPPIRHRTLGHHHKLYQGVMKVYSWWATCRYARSGGKMANQKESWIGRRMRFDLMTILSLIKYWKIWLMILVVVYVALICCFIF